MFNKLRHISMINDIIHWTIAVTVALVTVDMAVTAAIAAWEATMGATAA